MSAGRCNGPPAELAERISVPLIGRLGIQPYLTVSRETAEKETATAE
jgi:hypothetical protein